MRTIRVADLQHEAARYLALAAEEDIVILQDGKPVALLRGFSEADDRLDYQLETHPLFLERVRRARKAFHAGQSERLEDLRDELLQADDPS